jgi:TonB dependent receptor/TonB-dependent Receptor Plug Domain
MHSGKGRASIARPVPVCPRFWFVAVVAVVGVPATWTVRLHAEPPPSVPSTTPTPAPEPAPDALKKSDKRGKRDKSDPSEEPAEVRIQGRRRDVGGVAMRREEAREIPGTFGDPARFVETMPGVVPTTSGLQAFYVRGAPPETTGYYVDGVPVPALYHVGFGPSVVHPGLLDRAELFSGAAPAYFGRAIGATIAGDTTEPAPRVHGEGNVRILDTSAFVETPFADGRGSAEVSGRYAYPGLIVPLFAPDVGLSYWDYQTRVTWNLSERDRIGLFIFGSSDRLTQNETNFAGVPYTAQLVNTVFHRADLRYDLALGGGSTFRLAATAGYDTTGNEVSNIDATSARLRAELDARVSKTLRVRAGADAQWTHYALGTSPLQPADPTPTGFPLINPRDDVVAGAYIDVAWRIARRVEIVPGLRADVFTTLASSGGGTAGSTTPTFDPRLAARVTLAPRVTAVSTIGVSHQSPGLIAFTPEVTASAQIPGAERGIQEAEQLSEGVEIALPEGFVASATGFLHHYSGLPDLTAPCVETVGARAADATCFAQPADGRAYGLELLVRRALTERFAILVSYTLSRSVREAHALGEPTVWIPSEYDRTHVGSAIATYDLGKRWRIGARFFGYTGRPYSHSYEGIAVPPFNTERLPGFWRLDLRLEKSWEVGRTGRVAFVVEGLNVTFNKEVVDLNCQNAPGVAPVNYAGGALPAGAKYDVCTPDPLGPITIPSIGVEGAF